MNNFVKTIGLALAMTIGLSACGDNEEKVVVERKVVQVVEVEPQPQPQPLWTPPTTIVQNYTFADVERTYLQCLQTYGVHNDDMCEEYCSIYYNAASCDTVEDYYEDRYGIGRDDHKVDTSALFAAGAVGYFMGSADHKTVIVNKHYGKPVRTVSKKYSSVKPVRVVKAGKVVPASLIKSGSTTVVKPGKVATATKVTDPKVNKVGTVSKIGTGGTTKQATQFSATKPSSKQVTAPVGTAKPVAGKPATTVTKVGTGGTAKTANQFTTKKPTAVKPAATKVKPAVRKPVQTQFSTKPKATNTYKKPTNTYKKPTSTYKKPASTYKKSNSSSYKSSSSSRSSSSSTRRSGRR